MKESTLLKKSLKDLQQILNKLIQQKQINLPKSNQIDKLTKKELIQLIVMYNSDNLQNNNNNPQKENKLYQENNASSQSSVTMSEMNSNISNIESKKEALNAKEESFLTNTNYNNSVIVLASDAKHFNRQLLYENVSTNNNLSVTSITQPNGSNIPKLSTEPVINVSGILEIMPDSTHGILRTAKLTPSNRDTYISVSQVKKLKLRKGDFIEGIARYPKENERYHSLIWVNSINGINAEELKDRPLFEDLKPIYPNRQIKLECGQYPISNRIMDLLTPIGFGQRAMIVAPPKAGKTTLLKDIAKGINHNHPEVQLIVVLIGERPEEVTDIERSVNGIVYASNFDESPQDQVTVAELSLERAKRLVELGHDVVILMDSLTRLARAYNVALPASGRTLSGGLDPVSIYPSKKFFGAARNFENGASLTIIATALVETGSKMDEVIFEEFKGTGNMELKLDRKLANKRIFPAIDIKNSGTRNEELLIGSDLLQISWKIRRMLDTLDDGVEALIDRMKMTKNNQEFISTLYQ